MGNTSSKKPLKRKIVRIYGNETADPVGDGKERTHDVVISVKVDSAVRTCGWLFEQAERGFKEAGIKSRLVGLRTTESNESSLVDHMLMEFNNELRSLEHLSELEAMFACEGAGDAPGKGKVTVMDFSVEKEVGKGAFGVVFQVRHKETCKIYAMKVMDKTRLFEKQRRVLRAIEERKAMTRLKGSKFVVGLHYAFQTKKRLFFVMDFCPGGDLEYHRKRCGGHFSEPVAKYYFLEVLLGLEFLHKNEIVYRDLKTQNILLDDQGHARLTDFGLVGKGSENTNSAFDDVNTSYVGTCGFQAPEILRGEAHGYAVDIYALGCLLFFMLSGCLPHMYGSWDDLNARRARRERIHFPPNITGECLDLCKRLLRSKAADRPRVKEIREHPWFNGVEWDAIEAQALPGPIDPSSNQGHFVRRGACELSTRSDGPANVSNYMPDISLQGA